MCAKRAVFLSALSVLSLMAQTPNKPRINPLEAKVVMPVLGYVVSDSPLEVRALNGIPGSAWLSDPLPIPEGTLSVRLAPGHSWALVRRQSRRAEIWTPEDGGVTPLAESDGDFPSAAFAPSGRLLVLASADGRLLRYRELPGSPVVDKVSIPQQVEAIAINDAGTWLAARAGGKLSLIDLATGNANFVYESTRIAAFGFGVGSDELVIADAGRSRAVLVENGVPRIIWSNTSGEPSSVWLEAGRLFITCESGGTLSVVATGTLQRSDLAVDAGGRVERLKEDSMLLLNQMNGDSQGRFGYLRDGEYRVGFWSPISSASMVRR